MYISQLLFKLYSESHTVVQMQNFAWVKQYMITLYKLTNFSLKESVHIAKFAEVEGIVPPLLTLFQTTKF